MSSDLTKALRAAVEFTEETFERQIGDNSLNSQVANEHIQEVMEKLIAVVEAVDAYQRYSPGNGHYRSMTEAIIDLRAAVMPEGK